MVILLLSSVYFALKRCCQPLKDLVVNPGILALWEAGLTKPLRTCLRVAGAGHRLGPRFTIVEGFLEFAGHHQ